MKQIMRSDRNINGFVAGLAAICAATAAFLVQVKASKSDIAASIFCTFDTDHLQVIHYTAVITGVVLFILSFFNFFYEAKSLFKFVLTTCYITITLILYALMLLYKKFNERYMPGFQLSRYRCQNAPGAKDMIEVDFALFMAIAVLDILAFLCLRSAEIGIWEIKNKT